MNFILHIIIGFMMSFIGLIPPGMLNMTVVRLTIEKNQFAAFKFSLGASFIAIIQAFIALYFANYFSNHPEVINQISWVGGIVLLMLSVFFFIKARQKFKGEGKKKVNHELIVGMIMSSLNMLAIPYYLFYSVYLENESWLVIQYPYLLFFIVGVGLGTLFLFHIYSKFALVISKRAQFIARNINYILSFLFFILGILTIIKLF